MVITYRNNLKIIYFHAFAEPQVMNTSAMIFQNYMCSLNVKSLKIPAGVQVIGYKKYVTIDNYEPDSTNYEEFTTYGPYTGPTTIGEVDGKGEWESYKIVGKIYVFSEKKISGTNI